MKPPKVDTQIYKMDNKVKRLPILNHPKITKGMLKIKYKPQNKPLKTP